MWSGHSVVDLGCGMGLYVKALRANGIDAIGVDGNPATPALAGEYCSVTDLTSTSALSTQPQHCWGISLAVAQCIPVEHEASYINNLAGACTAGLVMSWASPGLGGLGHVNEQPQDYVRRTCMRRTV